MNRLLGAFVGGIVLTGTLGAATAERYASHYAQDRAEIEDLEARYLFALDWQKPELYASTFTEDGVLIWARGTARGREAIIKDMQEARDVDARAAAGVAPLRPARRRHFISNVVLRIEGDRATERAYWFEFNDDARDRRPYLGAYGHYEDELRHINGQWLFSKRQIFNEQRDDMAASDQNPAW